MLGRDLQSADLADWRRLAAHLAERQRQTLRDAVDRVLSRGVLGEGAPMVGAGVGRFLLRPLAERLRRPYVDFASLVEGEPATREWAARCAPAAAVAILAAEGW
jgi:(4-(4-[2-(gamma-L-glutamylamino)ethyl]phenoxymethyl)furan-2-yl)methanamine synthase